MSTRQTKIVVLDRDKVIDCLGVPSEGSTPQCFICGHSHLESEDQPRRRYEEQTTLFKSLFMTPVFQKKVSPPIYEHFSSNIDTCGNCLAMIKEVYGLHKEISSMQQELDGLLERGRENMSARCINSPTKLTKETLAPRGRKKAKSDKTVFPKVPLIKQEGHMPDCSREEVESHPEDNQEKDGSPTKTRPVRQSKLKASKTWESLCGQDNKNKKNEKSVGANLDGNDDDPVDSSKLSCSQCGKVLATKFTMVRHEIEVCNVPYDPEKLKRLNVYVALYPCELCEKVVTCKTELYRHLKTHTQEAGEKVEIKILPKRKRIRPLKEYPCSKCGKVLKELVRKIYHEITVCKIHYDDDELKRYNVHLLKCDQCERQFLYQKNLKIHMLTHTGSRPYHCDKCGKDFRYIDKFRIHQKAYCPKGDIDPEITKHFEQRRIHNRARNGFRCPECYKRFKGRKELFEHYASSSHGGGKHQVVCEICGKSISGHPGVLNKHIRNVHNKEVRFTCSYCQKGFYESSLLARHVKTIHEKDVTLKSLQNKDDHIEKEEDGKEQVSGGQEQLHEEHSSTLSDNGNGVPEVGMEVILE